MNKDNLLLIFIKNPIAGNVKTRLGQQIGDDRAVEYYKKLLILTKNASDDSKADKWLCYGDFINYEDDWSEEVFVKKLQRGHNLGERMRSFFTQGFDEGYKRIVIIGSDCPDLKTADIDNAFNRLNESDVVIGPANDGGYYLLGMAKNVNLFANKDWSTSSVYRETINDTIEQGLSFTELEEKTDLDTIEDLKKFPDL